MTHLTKISYSVTHLTRIRKPLHQKQYLKGRLFKIGGTEISDVSFYPERKFFMTYKITEIVEKQTNKFAFGWTGGTMSSTLCYSDNPQIQHGRSERNLNREKRRKASTLFTFLKIRH